MTPGRYDRQFKRRGVRCERPSPRAKVRAAGWRSGLGNGGEKRIWFNTCSCGSRSGATAVAGRFLRGTLAGGQLSGPAGPEFLFTPPSV